MKLTFFHGTSQSNAKKIMKEGFKTNIKNNWKIKSKEGFVYFSLAYAPFYANHHKTNKLALIKVEIDTEDLYPEDDFIMFMKDKSKYTQEELNQVDLEEYKDTWNLSLQYLGNVCAKPDKVKILGVRYFNGKMLVAKCDPVISTLNYRILGKYYQELTEWIYMGGDPLKFEGDIIPGLKIGL